MKRLLVALIAVALTCLPLNGQWAAVLAGRTPVAAGSTVAIDTTAKAGGASPSITSVVTITVNGANSNRCLVVVAGAGDPDGTGHRVITGVNSVLGGAFTKITGTEVASSDWVGGSGWYLLAPANGSHVITVTYTNTCDQTDAFALSLYNVDQSTPFGTAATATAISGTASGSVTLGSDDLLVAFICTDAAALTNTVGTRAQYDANVGGDTSFEAGTNTGTGSIAYTSTLTSDDWVWIGIPVNGAP